MSTTLEPQKLLHNIILLIFKSRFSAFSRFLFSVLASKLQKVLLRILKTADNEADVKAFEKLAQTSIRKKL